MNAITTIIQPSAQLTGNEIMLRGDVFDRLSAISEIMAAGKTTVPDHLRNNRADCFAVAMQAMQWGMNPFVVAQKTHLVSGRLGYEAQLVNAAAQSMGAIRGRFHYEYQGDGEALQCRVGAIPAGEDAVVWGEWLAFRSVTTRNSPLWKTNPKQQLGYLQVKNWLRLYQPGAILGVYTLDELAESPPRDMGMVDRVETAVASLLPESPGETVDDVIIAMNMAMDRQSLEAALARGKAFAKGTPERRAIVARYRKLLPEFEVPIEPEPAPPPADNVEFFAGMEAEAAREGQA